MSCNVSLKRNASSGHRKSHITLEQRNISNTLKFSVIWYAMHNVIFTCAQKELTASRLNLQSPHETLIANSSTLMLQLTFSMLFNCREHQRGQTWASRHTTFYSSLLDGLIHRLNQKKLQHFVLWWFYVRLGLVDNILKVGQNWSMGRCPISKMIFVDLQVIFLHFTQVFSYSISHESVTSDVESSLIPYLGLPVPQPILVLHLLYLIFIILSVTHILRAALTEFPVCVCNVCVCNYSFQTTEPVCIKIIPANRASYADFYRLLTFEIFTPPYL